MAKSSKPTDCPHSGTGHLVRNFPFESNTCIRRFIGSATYTLLFLGSTATEVGSLNCPSPVLLLPQIDSTRPSGRDLETRVCPLPSTAIPVGELNCPLPAPLPP